MPFQKRNLRDAAKKRSQGTFLKEFPQKAQKRFESIANKMKELSSPFSTTRIKKVRQKVSASQHSSPPVDFIAAFEDNISPNSSEQSASTSDQIKNDACSQDSKSTHTNKDNHPHEFSGFFQYPRYTKRSFFMAGILLLLFWGIFFTQVQSFLQNISNSNGAKDTVDTLAKSFGTDLKMDNQYRTNILLLGSGGKNHEGGYLTDSIIVASFNHNTRSLSLFSIPRDLYVSYSLAGQKRKVKINALFRDGVNYWKFRKTNQSEIFENASLVIRKEIEDIIGSDIQYTAYIDFKGFESIVDALGGLDIMVEKDIYDPSYPADNYQYQTFSLEKGPHILDGKTALKYVRSRHGNAGGDFGRSYRQKKALLALKNQAFEQGVLTDPQKITQMLTIIKKNFWTDLSFTEMLSLVSLFQDLKKENIVSVGITDTVKQGIGGFLYTPPRDDIERRMSVFLPYLNGEKNPFAQISFYWETVSTQPDLVSGNIKIEVYNTTKRSGLASDTAQNLLRYAIPTSAVGNIDNQIPHTYCEYIDTPSNKKIAQFLKRKLNMDFIPRDSSHLPDTNGVLVNEDTPLNPLEMNMFRIFIGKDFNRNAYTGTLIRTPLSISQNPEN